MAGYGRSPEGGIGVALFEGTGRADTQIMRSSLKFSAAVSVIAYVAGAAAVLWRKRAW
jgi:hypothetical protein